jgi:hypothetical protein
MDDVDDESRSGFLELAGQYDARAADIYVTGTDCAAER